MPRANPGEVWIVDLGLVAKVRPCLLLSDYPKDDELSLVIMVPHTTAVRNNRSRGVDPQDVSPERGVPSSAASVGLDRPSAKEDRGTGRRGTRTASFQAERASPSCPAGDRYKGHTALSVDGSRWRLVE